MSIYENRPSKMFFLTSKNFFMNFVLKMGLKMNLRIITKNYAADPEIGFRTKSIRMPNANATAIPTAWELKSTFDLFSLMDLEVLIIISKFISPANCIFPIT